MPKFLSDGWLTVSARVGRQPTIDYASCVLFNFTLLHPMGGITPDNVRILNRFTGLLDEEWFLKTHIIIESEAARIVSAVYDAADAARRCDIGHLLTQLTWMEQALSHVASTTLHVFERHDEEGYPRERRVPPSRCPYLRLRLHM